MFFHLLGFTGIWEWGIVLVILLLIFGASRIPKLARGLGEGVSEFKKGLKEGEQEAEQNEDQKEIATADGAKDHDESGSS